MSSKKKKNSKKPAVGSPAAGSNNKKAKTNPNNPQKEKSKADNSGKKSVQKSKDKNQPKVKEQQRLNKQKEKEQKALLLQKEKQKKQQENKLNFQKRQEEKDRQRLNKQKTKEQKELLSQKKKVEKSALNAKKEKPKVVRNIKKFTSTYNVGKIVAALGIIIVAIAGIIILVSSLVPAKNVPQQVKDAEYKGRNESAVSSYDIELSAEQQKKLAKTVKSRGNKGAFSFFVNEEIVIEDFDDPALIDFGSISSNDCILVAFIVDEDGSVIYRTLGVEPGKGIRSVNLFNEVSYGTHKATLVVNGYDKETYKKIGTQTVGIKLKIGVDSVEK